MDSANLENLLQLKISRFTADTSGTMLSFSLAHQGDDYRWYVLKAKD